MSGQINYTRMIKNNTLAANKMEENHSIEGTLIGFQPGNYGKNNVLVMVADQVVTIFPAGNIQFIEKDVTRGKIAVGHKIRITRTGSKAMTNKAGQSYVTSVFLIENLSKPFSIAPQTTTAVAPAPTTAVTPQVSLEDEQARLEAQLAAIKARAAGLATTAQATAQVVNS